MSAIVTEKGTSLPMREYVLELHYAVWFWMIRAELARGVGRFMSDRLSEPKDDRRARAFSSECRMLAVERAFDRVWMEQGLDPARMRSSALVSGGFGRTLCIFADSTADAQFEEFLFESMRRMFDLNAQVVSLH